MKLDPSGSAIHWLCASLCVLVTTTSQELTAQEKSEAYNEIIWTDLIPPDDLAALLNPPQVIANIEDGSAGDQLSSDIGNALAQQEDGPYFQALRSTRIIGGYNDTKIRIPGFIVPVEFDDDQLITSFFLVPYFGACLHLPPPPPNQIIFATHEAGFRLAELITPFWVEGTLRTEITDNGLATAAYSMSVDHLLEYEENEDYE